MLNKTREKRLRCCGYIATMRTRASKFLAGSDNMGRVWLVFNRNRIMNKDFKILGEFLEYFNILGRGGGRKETPMQFFSNLKFKDFKSSLILLEAACKI